MPNLTTVAAPAAPRPEPPRPTRNNRVDALRFIAIAMVVLTHVLNLRPEFKELAPWLVRAMMSFNMPLFAFVSGYVLVGREGAHPLRFIKGKALALLVPYFAWIAVEMPLRKVTWAEAPLRMLRATYDPKASFQMWFLLVIFVAFVLFAIARWASSSDALTAVGALAIGLLPLLPLPDSNLLVRLCWLYPFLVMGYLVGTHRDRLRGIDIAAALAGLVIFPLVFRMGGTDIFSRFALGTSGIAALWGFSQPMSEALLAPLGWLGQKTLGIYGGQMVLLPFLVVGAGWPGAMATWGLVLVATVLLTMVLERTAVTRALFLGRWPKKRRTVADGARGTV